VTNQPFKSRLFSALRVAAISLPSALAHAAIDTRVWASRTLTVNGGMKRSALVATPQPLAVDGDDTLGRPKPEPFTQSPCESLKSPRHLLGSEQAEQPREAVMARRAVAQIDNLGQFVFIGGSKISKIHAAFRLAQSRDENNEQHRRQIVPRVEIARIANLTQISNQRFPQDLPNQEALSRIGFSRSRNTRMFICDSPARPCDPAQRRIGASRRRPCYARRRGRHNCPRAIGAGETGSQYFAPCAPPFQGQSRVVACRVIQAIRQSSPVADAADFRRIALSIDSAAEYPHFDRRAFKARVTFATLAPD
jgi:hypothetical protein